MAWITGNGNSVGPGIMSTGRVWHWAQLIVTSGSFVAGALRSGHTEDGLRQVRAGSDTPERPASSRDVAPTRLNIPDHTWTWFRHARSAAGTTCILACASRSDALGVAEDEIEIARVHEKPGGLPDDEHRVPPMEGVGQERHAAPQGEIPEGTRDHALALTFGGDPLDEESRREERLAEKSDAEPKLIRGHRHILMVAPRVERSRVGCRAGAMTEGAYEARLNMARRTLYALRTSSGRRRPETRAKIFSASSVGTVLLLSPTSVRSRRGTSSATETRYRLSMEIDFSPRSTSPMNFPLSPDPLPRRSRLNASCLRRARNRCPRNFRTCLTARSVTGS